MCKILPIFRTYLQHTLPSRTANNNLLFKTHKKLNW